VRAEGFRQLSSLARSARQCATCAEGQGNAPRDETRRETLLQAEHHPVTHGQMGEVCSRSSTRSRKRAGEAVPETRTLA